jgi:hypothetical protein
VNFKHIFNHNDQGGFPMPLKEGHLLVDGKKTKKADIEYLFEHGEVIITLWMVYPYTQSQQRYRHPS